MKILELSRSYYPSVGGLEKFISDRLRIYDDINIDYDVVCTKYSTEKKDQDRKTKNVTYLSFYTPYNITPGIKEILNREYDILSINQVGRYFSDYSICYVKSLGRKIILTPHFYFHTDKHHILKKIHKGIVMPYILGLVDKIICFTTYEFEFWLNNFNINKNKLAIIPHYFDHKVGYQNNISSKSKAGKNYLLYVGRNERNKRIDLLIRAFNEIKLETYQIIMTIRREDLTDDLLKIVDANENIKLVGYISEAEKERLLCNMEALVLPSEFEAFGIVTMEAAKYKKTILCSSLPVLKEVTDQRGAIYFNNTVESMIAALKEFFMRDDSEKQKAGEINYRNLQRFSYEKVREQYKSLICEVLNS